MPFEPCSLVAGSCSFLPLTPSLPPPLESTLQYGVFGVDSDYDGLAEGLLYQFDSFVNGPGFDPNSKQFESHQVVYLAIYLVNSLVLFLLLSQARCGRPALAVC